MKLKRNDEIELTIQDVVYKGFGLGRYNGRVVFVPGTVTGDRVKVVITDRKKAYVRGRVLEMIETSENRTDPECDYFGLCGGCCWQHIPYEYQLEIKAKIIRDSFRNMGNLDIEIPEITASPDTCNYRNKMEFSFGTDDDGKVVLGQHKQGEFDRIVDIKHCLIYPKLCDKVVRITREFFNESGHFTTWDPHSHEGFLRQMVMRYAMNTDQLMVVLTTNPGEFKDVDKFAKLMQQEIPQLKSFTWAINDKHSDVFFMKEIKYALGDGHIVETLGERKYQISPMSFFQTNSHGAKLLYDKIREYAALTGKEDVLDAYCGTGSIGIYLADQAKSVWGVEVVQDAVFNARTNANLNGLDNTTFIQGQMRDAIPRLRGFIRNSLDLVIIDPPRAGMHKKAIKYLLDLKSKRLIYVSCNPTTLARDLKAFTSKGYALKKIAAFDLCPHTYHIETVVLLEKD